VLTSAWETIAMATAGMALAMLGAIPDPAGDGTLSISRIGTGQVSPLAAAVRHGCAAAGAAAQRAGTGLGLLLVRIVGLGPTAA
jgi:phosphonate transport system permease protein